MNNKETKQVRSLNSIDMILAKQFLELVLLARASLWKFAKSGQFIALLRVTDGINAWRNKDAIQWLKAKSAANDGVEL